MTQVICGTTNQIFYPNVILILAIFGILVSVSLMIYYIRKG